MSLYAKYVPAQLGGGGGDGAKGDLTESGSANLTVTGGTGAVNGTGTVLTLTGSTMLETVSSVLTITGGTNAVLGTGVTIQVKQATTSQAGYLSAADWNTFSAKQAAGNYITALTGDVTATGPGSVAATIAANAVTNAKAAQMATLTIKGNNTGGTANALDLTVSQVQTMLGTSGTNTGDVTIGTFGSSPTANGASISGQVLTLQPANGSNPGLITTASQTLAGVKFFSSGLLGVTDASNATAGNIGEAVRAAVAAGSNLPLTTATAANVTSISLTAGDWDVSGMICFTGTPTGTVYNMGLSTTSATLSTFGDNAYQTPTSPNAVADNCMTIPAWRLNVNTTTTVYLVARATFSVGSVGAYGRISARRVR